MYEINTQEIKKYRTGELVGNIALVFCAAVLVFFAVAFGIARINGIKPLEIVALCVSDRKSVV